MVFDKVKAILVDQLDVDENKVTMEASITDDLGADSLDIADIVMSIEASLDFREAFFLMEKPDCMLAANSVWQCRV